ncbi:sulfotransferase [Citreimonas sp.]|uniref:sulfotransferase family protein n=1 Tax=Citreimonas sp. TaxID=3036715 RepID=UPI0035C7CB31
MSTLPNFLVIGTAKAGTSSLARYLDQHPEVCFARVQEPNFFAFDHQFARGEDYYRSLYSHHAGEPRAGEKSWRYSCNAVYPQAFDRIREMLPELKLIYVLRDPVARGISMWRELRDAGQDIVDSDCERALLTDPLILDSMAYASTYRRFADAYGAENVLVLFFEDMVRDQDAFHARATDFLGISRFTPEAPIHENLSVGLRSDGRILEFMRRAGLDGLARKVLPDNLRALGRQHFKKPIGKVELSPQTRAAFLDKVRPEAAEALALAGKPADFWALE